MREREKRKIKKTSDLLEFYLQSSISAITLGRIFLVSFHQKSSRVQHRFSVFRQWETVLGLHNSPENWTEKKATLTFTFSTCHDIDRSPQQQQRARARGLRKKNFQKEFTHHINSLFLMENLILSNFVPDTQNFNFSPYKRKIFSSSDPMIHWTVHGPIIDFSHHHLAWISDSTTRAGSEVREKKLDQTEF